MSWSSCQSSGVNHTVGDKESCERMLADGPEESKDYYRLMLYLIDNFGGNQHLCFYHLGQGLAYVIVTPLETNWNWKCYRLYRRPLDGDWAKDSWK